MRSLLKVAGSVVVVLGLAACSTADDSSPALTAAPTASPTPSATPTPSPTIDYSDAELGILFEGDAGQWSGLEAEIYHWTAQLETEYWRTMTTGTVSPNLKAVASPEVQARMQQIVDNNAQVQLEFRGVFRVEIREIAVDGETARATACLNYADATFKDPNGTYTAEQVGFGGTSRQDLTLERVADQTWIVLTSTVEGKC